MCARNISVWKNNIRVVQSVGVSELSLDSKHARFANKSLIRRSSINQSCEIKTAELPDNIEEIVD